MNKIAKEVDQFVKNHTAAEKLAKAAAEAYPDQAAADQAVQIAILETAGRIFAAEIYAGMEPGYADSVNTAYRLWSEVRGAWRRPPSWYQDDTAASSPADQAESGDE